MKLITSLSPLLLALTGLFFVGFTCHVLADLPDGFPVTDGLSLYLDDESVELDNGHVVRWTDRSGAGNDALDMTPPRPTRPILLQAVTPSGQNAVRFDGVGGYAEIASNTDDFDGREKTTFVVFRADRLDGGTTAGRITNTAYAIIDDWVSVENQPSGRTRTNVMWADSGDAAGGALRVQNRNPDGQSIAVSTPSGSLAAGEFYVGAVQWRENGDTVSILRNTSNERFQHHTIGANAFPVGHIHTRLAASTATDTVTPELFFGGEIAAFLVYNRQLSQPEIEEVEQYLHELYLGTGSGGPLPVVDGLSVHLSAANVELQGERVFKFLDLSGKGNDAEVHVEGAEPPSKPTLLAGATPSGMDAISFDGQGGYMEIAPNPESFDGREKTILTVFRAGRLGLPGRFITSGYASGAGFPYYMTESLFATTTDGGTLRVTHRHASGNLNFSSPAGSVAAGEFYVGGTTVNTAGETQLFVRNVANQRFVTQQTGVDPEPTDHLFTRLGTGGPSGVNPNVQSESFYRGELAGVLIYNRALSESELTQVEEYLHQVYLGAGPAGGDPGQPPVTAGLVLHLNSANIETEGDIVTKMVDTSIHGNDAESFLFEEPRIAPVFVAEATPAGRGAVRFDGVRQYLEIAGNPASFDGREKTTIAVFSPHTFGLRRLIDMRYGITNTEVANSPGRELTNSMFTQASGNLRISNRTASAGTALVSSPNGSVVLNQFHVGINHWMASGDIYSIVRNPANERFVGHLSGADANPADHERIRIGSSARATVDDFYHGDLAAIVVFNRELSSSELEQVETYLYQRYMTSGEVPGAYQAWIAGFDVPEHLQGPDADASGDGILNLVKFALGLDPTEATRDGLPAPVIEEHNGEEYLTISLETNPDAGSVTFLVEVSNDLIDWRSGPGEVEIIDDTPGLLYARAVAPISNSEKQFLRVSISLDE